MSKRKTTMQLVKSDHAQMQRLVQRVREIRAEFQELHAKGKAALKARDYKALGEAIASENRLIVKHRALVEQQQALLKRRMT